MCESENGDGSQLELLYFSRGDTLAKESHEHPFYQLEIGLSGELHGKSGENWVCIRPGNFWLIPPETPHCFLRASTGTEFYSLKFKAKLLLPAMTTVDEVTRYHVDALMTLLEQGHAPSPYTASGKEIVEGHLMALLRHLKSREVKEGDTESDFIMRLREAISCEGYGVNVKELTNRFGCTRSQLKYKFVKEAGGETSLKHFISRMLLEMAISHLRYSDRSCVQIAELMHFQEPSLFSRFIKANTGLTPGQLRTKLRQENIPEHGSWGY